MADHHERKRPDDHASATVPAFHDRVAAALAARGLLDGVTAAITANHATFVDVFGRHVETGRVLRSQSIVHARRAAIAWLYLDAGAHLSAPEIERLTGFDTHTVYSAIDRVRGQRRES